MFEIEKDVPAPVNGASHGKYPWAQMEVGDSFMVPGGNVKSLRTTAYAASRRHGVKFRAGAVEGGVRIWRMG